MSKPNGYIIYEGPSMLDGKPIVAIATGFNDRSGNRKTGNMIQTWILRADMSPMDAIKGGHDASVCGQCPHRGDGTGKGRSCYVAVFQAPLAVYRAYKRGSYPYIAHCVDDDMAIFEGQAVRIGSYGDPVAVPVHIWQAVVRMAKSRTGYTHQWATPLGAGFRGMVQASCDSYADYERAMSEGWKTFMVRPMGTNPLSYQVDCPAQQGLTCDKCGLCNGRKADISIPVHGAGKKHFKGGL